jgi:hypothetical protein
MTYSLLVGKLMEHFSIQKHDYPNKRSLIYNEGSPKPIFWDNHYLMITQKAIKN